MSRIERVAQQLKREISQVLLLETRDPRIGFLTITQVEVSPDLRTAKVYYTILGDKKSQDRAQEGLKKASKFIRKRIAQRIKIKFIPEIKFFYDEDLTKTLRVEKLLDELKRQDN